MTLVRWSSRRRGMWLCKRLLGWALVCEIARLACPPTKLLIWVQNRTSATPLWPYIRTPKEKKRKKVIGVKDKGYKETRFVIRHVSTVLLLLNLVPWRYWAHKSHLVPPALTVFAEHRNIQINLLEVLVDNVLPVATWSALRSSRVFRWRFELLDDSWRVSFRSSRDVTHPANLVVKNSAGDIGLVGPPAELINGQQIGSVHALHYPESTGFSKPWMRKTRVLLRSHVSAPNIGKEKTAAS